MTLTETTFDDIPPTTILSKAFEADLSTVLVIGYEPDGKLYAASTTGDAAIIQALLQETQIVIRQAVREGDE